jgi:rubrerythrin
MNLGEPQEESATERSELRLLGCEIECRSLIGILQQAYSGERAAAYAYRGHWQSVSDPEERSGIQKIEEEEWHHRHCLAKMMEALDARPDPFLEVKAWLVGRTLGVACHFCGWFAPMYAAGRLESRNIREYQEAARRARACGCEDLIPRLLTMAEVEWEHEHYFRSKILGHPCSRYVPLWESPPPKEAIRTAYR